VLPEKLPSIAGWEMAAHYVPSGHLDAGGDFYDVLRLDAGRIAFFVGDVTGHGVHAAAAMAQMRSAVRAFAAVDPDPHTVLERLDRLFEQYEIDQLVTMIYAVVDPVRHELTLANAGHPAPVMLRADGTLESLLQPEDVLLGADGSNRPTATVPFLPGDALLAFTDGLIERRDEHLDTGMDRLLRACHQLGSGPLHQSLVELIETVHDPTRDDDLAALVLRRVKH
jgi:serine phosphatase RsbU (regulator of sigma subunit)